MRPRAIDWFDRFYLASLGAVLFNGIVVLTGSRSPLGSGADSAQWAGMIIGMVLGIAVQGALWFLVSRRTSNAARWVLAVLVALILVSNLITLPVVLAQRGVMVFGGTLVLSVLQIAALAMLFRGDSSRWFASGGKDGTPR